MINYEIYTDGSFKSSKNTGGWSAIITKDNKVITCLRNGMTNTTNNRQELFGVLEALKYFKTPNNLTIYSDSQYIVNSINQKYLHKWISEKDLSKKNLDIWNKIYQLINFHKVTFIWVKGHNKNKFNELSDLYAQHAADCLNLKEDVFKNN